MIATEIIASCKIKMSKPTSSPPPPSSFPSLLLHEGLCLYRTSTNAGVVAMNGIHQPPAVLRPPAGSCQAECTSIQSVSVQCLLIKTSTTANSDGDQLKDT